MLKYSKITDEETGLCQVATGTNEDFYKKIGMTLQDVTQSETDGLWYLTELCPKKTEEEKVKENEERINNLTMTALDFITGLQLFGLTLETINEYLEANLELKMQLTYCNNVYCSVVKQLCPLTVGDFTLTEEITEAMFLLKAGELSMDDVSALISSEDE